MVREPSLKALRAFEAVARLGSVSRASDELSVTPGAISRRIRELELDLEVTVLERHGRGVRLTFAGEKLKSGLCPAFEIINRAVLDMNHNLRRNTLVVATIPVFAMSWLLPRLPHFRQMHPEIDVITTNRFTDANVADSDIVIDWGFPDIMADAERLTQELVVPVCSPSICPDRTLAGVPLVHRHDLPSRYDFPDWPAFLQAVGVEVADPHAGPRVNGELILEAARAGMGVVLANSTIAREDLRSGRLVRPIEETMDTRAGYTISIRKVANNRSEASAFHTWLLGEIAGSVGQPLPPCTSRNASAVSR